MTINEINSLLFAKAGTKVKLTIFQGNREKEYKEYTLKSEPFTMYIMGLTPEQVKKSYNWDKAYYEPEFREQLGLPPEQREERKSN